MKRTRFTDEQIIGILPEHEAGAKCADLCRKHGMSDATLYKWKRRYVGMQVCELRRLKDLQLITDAGYQGMNIQFATSGWKRAEPEALLPEQLHRFESLAYRALAEDLISPSRAACCSSAKAASPCSRRGSPTPAG